MVGEGRKKLTKNTAGDKLTKNSTVLCNTIYFNVSSDIFRGITVCVVEKQLFHGKFEQISRYSCETSHFAGSFFTLLSEHCRVLRVESLLLKTCSCSDWLNQLRSSDEPITMRALKHRA